MFRNEFHLGRLHLRINWIVAAVILAAIAGLLRLGVWQLERAGEEIRLQEHYRAMAQQAPLPFAELQRTLDTSEPMQLQNRLLLLEGRYLSGRDLVVIYRPFKEQVGYEVISPFLLADSGEIVLVSRGWLSARPYAELKKSLGSLPGERTVQAQLFVADPDLEIPSDTIIGEEWPRRLRHLNLDELDELYAQPVFPHLLRLADGEAGALVRYWAEPQTDSGRNFSYALQWFSMAAALGLASLILCSNLAALWNLRAWLE